MLSDAACEASLPSPVPVWILDLILLEVVVQLLRVHYKDIRKERSFAVRALAAGICHCRQERKVILFWLFQGDE